MTRADAVVAVQQLLELEDELGYFFRSTREAWEHWHRQQDRRRHEHRWRALRPVADDLARVAKISDAELEFLATWARISVGALDACLTIIDACLRGNDIGAEAVLATAQAADRGFAELSEMLTGIDVAAIVDVLEAAGHEEVLDELRAEALDELTAVTKMYAGRTAGTLPAAALEGDVSIDKSIHAIASLAAALCRLLEPARPGEREPGIPRTVHDG